LQAEKGRRHKYPNIEQREFSTSELKQSYHGASNLQDEGGRVSGHISQRVQEDLGGNAVTASKGKGGEPEPVIGERKES